MIQHNNLHHYYDPDDASFDADAVEEMIYRADLHLVQRGLSGIFLIPLLFFITGYGSDFSVEHGLLLHGGGVIMLIASLGRLHSSYRLRAPELARRVRWQQYYYLTSLVTGLCWGLLAAAFLYYYSATWENTVVLFIVAGIAGGAVSSYSTWLSLNRIYLFFLLTPLILVCFVSSDDGLRLVGFLSLLCLIYNLGQVKLWNSIYWKSLVNMYLLKKEVATTRKMSEEILAARDRLRTITENVPGVLFQLYYHTDTKESDLNYASPRLEEIFGLDCLDDPRLLFQRFFEGIHKDDRQSWCDSIQDAAEKQVQWKWKGRYIRPSGERIWFEGQARVSIQGNKVIFDGILVDITGIRRLEEQKSRAEIQLHRAQKMEAIGMMAGGVAHDLNNILSGIVTYPQLLLLQLPESSELRRPVEAIQECGKRAATVVADLLTVARGAAVTKQPYDIHLLIREYLASPEYQKLISRYPGIVCTKQLEATNSVISCSPMHIRKVVMNLITNAAEALDNTGNIIISTRNEKIETDTTQFSDLQPGNYLVLTIEDDGPGIADKDLEHIFEPFYTKKVLGHSGTGLGLAIVWNTVQDHKGRISVESNDTGTRFHLYFPLSQETIAIRSEERQVEIQPGNKESILVVDDEENLRDIAARILRSLGYTVQCVASGEEAVEVVRKKSVDLVILDMVMDPGMNGRRTYEEIIKLHPGQRAVVATGFSESEDVRMTLKLGANGFIKKPYSVEQLGLAVQEALKSQEKAGGKSLPGSLRE